MKKATIIFGILAAAVAQSFAADMKPLKLDVPPSQLEGTPVPVKLAGQTPVEEPNPIPRVPADVKNIALKKAVTASDDFPLEGDLEFITNGDKGSSQGSYVELTGGLQFRLTSARNPKSLRLLYGTTTPRRGLTTTLLCSFPTTRNSRRTLSQSTTTTTTIPRNWARAKTSPGLRQTKASSFP